MTVPMEALLIATGFTGALTLRWLFGLIFRRASANLTPYFLPAGGAAETVIKAITDARNEVLLLANAFCSRTVAQALVDARMRGVSVEVILDAGNESDPTSEMPFLTDQGLPPMIDDKHALSRNCLVVDGARVLTGSFTFAPSAEEDGSENLLEVKGDAAVASAYRADIMAHKAHARAVPAKTATPPAPAPAVTPEIDIPVVEKPVEPQAIATQATTDLMARLRQELGAAASDTERPRDKHKKKAG